MAGKPTIAVVGAGMVGACCGLYLQREGFEVTIIDRDGPGEAASFGNLGSFGIASCVPGAMPGILKKIPGMLLDSEAPLKIRWGYAARALPWFFRFLQQSRRENVEANASARQSLLDKVHEGIDPLVADAEATHLMNQAGLLFTFESEAAFEGASYAFDLRRRNGALLDVLDGNEARQVEPALSPNVVRGIRVPNLTHTFDPLRLVQALVTLFERNGGRVERRSVRGFETGPDGVRAIRTDAGDLPVENVVLAAGVWSR
ncbi:MAG: FAD-dependent oxidoreductase, partial [Alphaproteobacteria bacterium]|nr:FAD-dependent oxidoreductase [Alphaproteobacteria bacterium]